jgi:molecular chaperone GrpE
MPGMSKKVQIETHDPKESDQSEEPASAEINDKEPSADSESEPKPEQDDLKAELKAAQDKAEDHYDRLLRLSAEFDNYKKRTSREMTDVVRYANEKLLKDLLIVVDNLERAISSADQDNPTDSSLVEGIHLTLNEVLKILQQYNVQPVKALGESFDPAIHQAMMQQEVENEPANTVVQEMQKGYRIHERLLRPAMVVVSKAKDTPDSAPTSD